MKIRLILKKKKNWDKRQNSLVWVSFVTSLETRTYSYEGSDGNRYKIWDATIEKNYMLKKNNQTQNSIFVVRQFSFVHGVAGISLFSGKKYRVR